jgi:hypothetical protein
LTGIDYPVMQHDNPPTRKRPIPGKGETDSIAGDTSLGDQPQSPFKRPASRMSNCQFSALATCRPLVGSSVADVMQCGCLRVDLPWLPASTRRFPIDGSIHAEHWPAQTALPLQHARFNRRRSKPDTSQEACRQPLFRRVRSVRVEPQHLIFYMSTFCLACALPKETVLSLDDRGALTNPDTSDRPLIDHQGLRSTRTYIFNCCTTSVIKAQRFSLTTAAATAALDEPTVAECSKASLPSGSSPAELPRMC